MQVSLTQMVELLSDMAKQPFSIPLQEELKIIFNIKRADWLQKIIDKHPEQHRFFLKYISDELVDVDEIECPLPESGCTVKRTSKKIPMPVRNSHMLFWYVGDPDRLDGYTYTTPDQLSYIINYGSRYTQDRPKYFYVNGYVYIYNDPALEYITIGGVWSDPRSLNGFKCDDQPCYTDDDPYDIPDDILNIMIQDVLKNELKWLVSQDSTEVTLDENTTKQ